MASITETKLCPSDELANVIGSGKVTRPQAVKKFWAYVKKNKLQDNKNKRMINADGKLKPLFGGKKQISMFDVGKIMSKHLED